MSRIMIFASLFWMTTVAQAAEEGLCGATGFAEELKESFGGEWTAAHAHTKFSNITLKRGYTTSTQAAAPEDGYLWFVPSSAETAPEPQDALAWIPAPSPAADGTFDSRAGSGVLKASMASSSLVGKGARQAIDDILGGGEQAGAKASDAYFVKVDRETTTQNSAGGMRTDIICTAVDGSRTKATVYWSAPVADGYVLDLGDEALLVLDLASL